MITGLDLTQTVDYVLKDDKENPTVWKLGIVGSSLFAKIHNNGLDDIATFFSYLQVALRGWENFNVPFETKKEKFFGVEREVVPMDILNRIDLKTISELYVEAVKLTRLSENERKN